MPQPMPSAPATSPVVALPPLSDRQTVERQLAWLAAGFIFISGALVLLALFYMRTQALKAGERLTESFAHVIEEQTTRTLQTVDQRLQIAASSLESLEKSGELNEKSAQALLRKQLKELPFARALWVLDAQGRAQYDSNEGNIGMNLSDRAYFQVYQSHPETSFHLGLPVIGRPDGAWLISASRPLYSKGSDFKGIIVAALEPKYFDQMWSSIDLGPGGSIALFRRDGVLMMRSPHIDSAIGKSFQDRPIFKDYVSKSPTGNYLDASAIDGTMRLLSYRILPNQPDLLVLVGQSHQLVLAPWRSMAMLALFIWLIAAAAITGLCVVLGRSWQQRMRAEEQSKKIAQRLSMATDCAHISVWEWDLGADHWEATPTYFRMLGYEPEAGSVSNAVWLERIHPDDQARVSASIQAALDNQVATYTYEARLRHADGSYRWVHVVGRVIAHDAQGKAIRSLGVTTDITERKQAEEALRASQLRYRDLFENSPVAMWVYDRQTLRFLAVNDAACAQYGYDRGEFSCMTLRDIRPQEDVEKMQTHLQGLKGDLSEPVTWRHRRKDGSIILVDTSGHSLNFDGHEARMVLAMNVTARKQAEEKLRLSEENLSITLQSIGDAVIATDPAGLITRMNPTAERLTAWPLAEALGKPLTEVFHIINAQTRALAVNPVQLVMTHGEVVGLANHTALLARDGREYQIFDSAAPIRNAVADIVGVVLVFSDVTEAYKVREDLGRMAELLERTGELAQVGGWEMDLRTQELFFSKEALRINEIEPTEKPTVEQGYALYSEDVRPVIQAAIRAAIEEGTPYDLELPRTTGKGREIWVRTQGTAIFEDGKAIKLLGAFQDITERKQTELAFQESEQRFRNLIEWTPEAIAVHRKGVILFVNPAAIKLFGARSDQDLVGTQMLDRVHPDFHQIVLTRTQNIAHQGDAAPMLEEQFLRLDGSVVDLEVQGTRITFDGAPAVQVAMRDITERKRSQRAIMAAQSALAASALHTQTILDNLMDGVITIDPKGLIETFNKAASAMFGYETDEILGRNVSSLMPEPRRSQHDSFLTRFNSSGQGSAIGKLLELEGQRKDGSVFHMSLQVSQMSNAGTTTFIGIVRDITQNRKDVEEIRRLAFYDPLTNLPNRRLLMDRLKQAMMTSARTTQHGALMFLDLDHFKQLNDTLGHDVGDVLLQQVSVRLQACVREGDSVARLGGDEFVILLEALSPMEREAATQAELIATKVLDAFGQSFDLRGHSYESTPSIGIVVFMGALDSIDNLLKKADVAMYQAKAAGRNAARFFDPAMQAVVAEHDALEKDLRNALVAQEFILHYQIQVDTTGTPIGAEALVRWRHPRRGMVTPAQFIPMAESTGVILQLGQWVLETACEQLVHWASQPATAHWTMAVNVSAVQFAQEDYVATVATALKKTGANPERLKLELTESMLVNDVEDVIAKMNDIKGFGVAFSLDDFGTGYSSLSHLKRLSLDQLKIDQSFVRDILTDSSDAVIARTIVALGHSLGLKVIAEGVETAAQRDVLASMGCDAFQGYYFGRPVPAKELTRFESNYPF